MKNGTVLKFNEPPEAKRTKGWRVYVYKNDKEIDVLELDGQSSFLVGRDRSVPPPLFLVKEFWTDNVRRLLISLLIIIHVPSNMQ